MRSRVFVATLVGSLLMLTGGCATSTQWAEWEQHPTHFASGGHAIFSLRNNENGSNPLVTRTDIERARTERWWGTAITVSPGQIFQS